MTELKSTSKHFEVTVAGQYHAMNAVSGTPTLKLYKETFILPSQEAALSAICKHLLSPRLKKTHSDFIRYRTHELVSIVLKNYKPDIDVLQMDIMDMNLLELHDFCILRQLTIDPYKHAKEDIFKIRTQVQAAYQAKKQSEKDAKESKHAVENSEAETLRKANDLDAPSGTDINVNEHLATQAAHGAAKPVAVAETAVAEPLDEPLPEAEPESILE